MYNILPMFKSHYSLGRSILTLEKPADKKDKKYKAGQYSSSIFDLLIDNQLDTLVLVEDNMSGLLQVSKQCEDSKIKLVFGLRLDVTENMDQKDDAAMMKRAKYIIMGNKPAAYKKLIKISSLASRQGFYYKPAIDFKHLKDLWDDSLTLIVPFYDSFIYQNTFNSHLHVPDFGFTKPLFLTEDNDLPFDEPLLNRVNSYAKGVFDILPAQSIFYKSPDDFDAYVAFRCIHNRGSNQKSTLDKPELEHMGSNQFNFDKWMTRNQA